MSTTKPLTIDPELARRLKEAAAVGRSVVVMIDDQPYQLSLTPEPTTDIWEGYDPEKVRAAIQRSVPMGSSAMSTEALDLLIADIRAQRDQAYDDTMS